MKTLVLYNSFGGSTRHVAERIAQTLNADLAEAAPLRSLKWLGPLVFVVGGYQAIKGKTPELKPLDKNPADYDMIVLGTPVWGGNCTPAIRSVLKDHSLAGKKVALFAVSGSGDSPVTGKLKEELEGCDIVGTIELQGGRTGREKSLEQAEKWAGELKR